METFLTFAMLLREVQRRSLIISCGRDRKVVGQGKHRVSISLIIIFPPPAIAILKQAPFFTWPSISGTQVLHNVFPPLYPLHGNH